jgi:outer membrane protein TolC
LAAAPPSPTRTAGDDGTFVTPWPQAIDEAHEYSLVELIDIAQRSNPETRVAWEQARTAAARLGRAEAVYLPVLALAAEGGARRDAFPSGMGQFTAQGPYVEPRLELAWTMLDLPGFAAVDGALAQVKQANFAFSRRHQEVTFAVARAFYVLDAARARLGAAQATLRTATIVEAAVQARLEVGLATRPELLLARQQRARAAFDLEAASGAVRSSQGGLAEAVGVSPVPPLRTTPLEAQHLPERLDLPVRRILAATLRDRPDLKALTAGVRARDADLHGARGSFAPRLSLRAEVGYQGWRYQAMPPDRSFSNSAYEYRGQLRIDWELFEGFARQNDVRAALAERAASEAALTAGTLRALREAWTAYFDLETAQRQVEFAAALLASAEEAYDSALETYRRGLGTVIDLITAERDLASARSTAIDSRAQLLTAAAALTFAVGGAEAAR